MDNLDQIVSEAQAAFAAISDPDALEQAKARFLGKSGHITELLKGLGKLPPEEKKTAGAAINVAKTAVENALNARREAIRKASGFTTCGVLPAKGLHGKGYGFYRFHRRVFHT